MNKKFQERLNSIKRKYMKYQELMKQMRSGQPANIYLFTGPEEYIAKMMEKQLIQTVIPAGLNQLNVMHFKDKDFEIGEVIASCRQLPMMSEHRVVVLREETGLCHSSDTKTVNAFCAYLENPEPSTILIVHDSKPDKRKKVYKTLKKVAAVVDYEKLNMVELENWIAMRFKRAHKKIGTRTLRNLIERTRYLTSDACDMAMIDNRVAQLIDYLGAETQVRLPDVAEVVPDAVDDNIFKMIDHALGGNMAGAIEMLGRFYLQGESPFGVFGLLAGQIRTMMQVCLLSHRRMPVNMIAKKVGRPVFVVKKMADRSRKYGLNKLRGWMIALGDLDLSMKTGAIDPELGIELFMMRLA